ncbi:hypothetical protein Tco_1333647 [Tanacetum coccineum]
MRRSLSRGKKLNEARHVRRVMPIIRHRRLLEFQPGEHVFLKVSPTRGVRRFGIKGKLSPRFIGPFEILERRWVRRVKLQVIASSPRCLLSIWSDPWEDISYTEEPESI